MTNYDKYEKDTHKPFQYVPRLEKVDTENVYIGKNKKGNFILNDWQETNIRIEVPSQYKDQPTSHLRWNDGDGYVWSDRTPVIYKDGLR